MYRLICAALLLENIFLAYKYRYKTVEKIKRILISYFYRPVKIIRRQEGNWWADDCPLLILHGAGGLNNKKYNNSRESIMHGVQIGFKVIEIDVGETADGVFVLTHRFRPDDEIIYKERPSLDQFLENGATEGETGLSLEAAVKLIDCLDVRCLIDCEHGIEYKVCEWFDKNVSVTKRRNVIFQVHTPDMLKRIYKSRVFENIHYNGDLADTINNLKLLRDCGVYTCSISDEDVSQHETDLKKLLESGIHVIVYTINHRRRLEALLKGG